MANIFSIFENVNGASFVGIDTLVNVKLVGGKSNPQQGRVTKRMTGASVMVFQNKNISGYEAMVQRRLEAEGKNPASFTVGPRAWGTRVEGTPIVEHKGQLYLEVIFLKPGKVQYLLDGQEVNEDDIQGLGAASFGEQGGLENKVVIRTFKLDSITAIRIDGLEYTNITP